ncbi:hypothetical protein WJX73_005407 [Symbiochloris irregularis]|uniref:UspA domain-containing protein n=1 Tax=Symbiochloris irregularis TaxID=706552 RepID=A0AAW1PVI7_9CHLO
MQISSEESRTHSNGQSGQRQWLVPVDDSEICENALLWASENLVRTGDHLHLLHVIPVQAPEMLSGTGMGMSGGDFVLAEPDPAADKEEMQHTKEFITKRFIPRLDALKLPYTVEVVHFATDCDSIGQMVCQRGQALGAAGIVLSKHNKGKVAEFFLGSVTNYCTHHAQQPVIVFQ